MSGRERPTRRLTPRQLLVIVVALAATACGGAGSTSEAPDALSGRPSRTAVAASATRPSPPALLATRARATGAPTPPTPPTAPTATAAIDATGPARTMEAATPVRLQIPAIGVDSGLVGLGLELDGTLQVPPTGFPAGWYTGAPTPGELGPAIIAGHVDWGGRPGVFFDLRELLPGDEITVVRGDGSVARFHVDRVDRFAKDEFPTELVYADLDHAGLRLITCGGDFDRSARSYVDNLVVFASLVDPGAGR